MSELTKAWKNQPEEARPVNLENLIDRRTRSLHSTTRAEILTAIGAAVFFVAVMSWRFASDRNGLPPLAFAAALAWVLISLYWFRARIRPLPKDALADTGLQHYRRQLERRRDHLKNPWLWLGPLFLACLTLSSIFTEGRFPAFRNARSILPLLILLALWVAFGWFQRRSQAAALQQELNELESSRPPTLN